MIRLQHAINVTNTIPHNGIFIVSLLYAVEKNTEFFKFIFVHVEINVNFVR